MNDLKEKIRAKLARPTLSVLATISEDGNPWARYVTPVFDENLNIWFATHKQSRKVAQISRRSDVHLTTGVTDMAAAESYLQIQGQAEILKDEKTKQARWFPELANIFSGPDDPNYVVVKITPYRIEYQGMGMTPPEIWES